MKSNIDIQASKITKPFQLLASWFGTLAIINGTFIYASTQNLNPSWLNIVLILASIINIYIFVFSIYRLLTKYRNELQEDQYYSERKNNTLNENIDAKEYIQNNNIDNSNEESVKLIYLGFAVSIQYFRSVYEIQKGKEEWQKFVKKWKKNDSFETELNVLKAIGFLNIEKGINNATITNQGEKIIESLNWIKAFARKRKI
ncbi:MAG: hypothetical protein A2086_16005 [Spirochaetes bacterium GWD1_27_9]|nr:MAG: hypothetical protein A2Z98_11380 [Spirochaetes bacterium GWB1_27_13]OHD22543.1 MAG: hypothetical protein A2Y34_11030 [Spirochaetes bacterium GWC1_27_15]OHD36219.1 MAG: hypothetical protein A2086_16005 [Spirochaetes bacterium GWD1_27_9]